jgi:hypothetical protein
MGSSATRATCFNGWRVILGTTPNGPAVNRAAPMKSI